MERDVNVRRAEDWHATNQLVHERHHDDADYGDPFMSKADRTADHWARDGKSDTASE